MINTALLEVLFGLAVLYFFFSLVCSAITELIATSLSWRSKILTSSLDRMLGKQLRQHVCNHPLIEGLKTEQGQLPSYIPPRLFALALVDTLRSDCVELSKVLSSCSDLRNVLLTVYDRHVPSQGTDGERQQQQAREERANAARALIVLIDDLPQLQSPAPQGDAPDAMPDAMPGGGNAAPVTGASAIDVSGTSNAGPVPNDLLTRIEGWYDATMDRASGIYKRQTQRTLFAVAFIVVLLINLDTLKFSQRLWTDTTRRNVITQSLQKQLEKPGAKTLPETISGIKEADRVLAPGLELPFGWRPLTFEGKQLSETFIIFLDKFIGLLLSVFALMLGAQFWFDVLNKVTNLRGAGPKPLSSLDKLKDGVGSIGTKMP